ncbi:MAG: hypothetical protein L0Z53_23955 [Acidobacteriales bacterium]|nr:hypothetical protein [Terriglobales bacterium]
MNPTLIKGVADTEPITLRPSLRKNLGLLVLCSLFVAGGIWMGKSGEWPGYLIAGFFGLGIPVAILNSLPGASYLIIERDGLTMCNLFRKNRTLWEDVDEFFVVKMKQNGLTTHTMVGFNYSPSYDRTRTARKVAKFLSQCEGALPDTYGQKPQEFADYLNYRLAQSRAHSTRLSSAFAQ